MADCLGKPQYENMKISVSVISLCLERSSPRKRPSPRPRASSHDDGKLTPTSLDLSAVLGASSESVDFSNSVNEFCFEGNFAAGEISGN